MITQTELKELLHYNPDTGVFTRIKTVSSQARTGTVVGSPTNGYLVVRLINHAYYLHRLAFLYMTGAFPPNNTDHINGNPGDNRWCNLRPVTQAENNKNLSRSRINTSGVSGVCWHKNRNKWTARIKLSGRTKYIGIFADKADAIAARKAAEVEFGFHTNHGR